MRYYMLTLRKVQTQEIAIAVPDECDPERLRSFGYDLAIAEAAEEVADWGFEAEYELEDCRELGEAEAAQEQKDYGIVDLCDTVAACEKRRQVMEHQIQELRAKRAKEDHHG